MDLSQVKTLLEESFNKDLNEGKKRHIIFWYDDQAEFVDDIDDLTLANAKVLKLSDHNYFFAKYQLEKEDTESNYLIYASFAKPAPRENYLLDILKYSVEFSMDKAAVIMSDLGVTDDSLKNVFAKYPKFFNNKERYKVFKTYGIENYTEETVYIAVLSTLCKLPYPDLDECLRVLLMDEDLANSKYLEAIEKFGDIQAFWGLVEKYYGFADAEPSLEKLAIFMLVSSLSYSLVAELPATWKGYVSVRRADCVVFISNVMNHALYTQAYDKLAESLEDKLRVKEYIANWEVEHCLHCDTFKAFDEAILEKLNQQLLLDIGEFDQYREIIQARRTKHWYGLFKSEYESIYWAIELLACWNSIGQEMREVNPLEMVKKYTTQFFWMDSTYRKFYAAFDRIKNKENFMDLKEKLENTYVNAYLNTLSIKWSDALETLGQDWRIPGLVRQQDFYNTYVQPFKSRDERVFVIISDALRYEAAREFCELLNKDRKGSTEILFMQGSIPLYTPLGMASLLPHRSITIDETYQVSVDGTSGEGKRKPWRKSMREFPLSLTLLPLTMTLAFKGKKTDGRAKQETK